MDRTVERRRKSHRTPEWTPPINLEASADPGDSLIAPGERFTKGRLRGYAVAIGVLMADFHPSPCTMDAHLTGQAAVRPSKSEPAVPFAVSLGASLRIKLSCRRPTALPWQVRMAERRSQRRVRIVKDDPANPHGPWIVRNRGLWSPDSDRDILITANTHGACNALGDQG